MTGRLKCNRKGWEQIKKRLLKFDERQFDVGFLDNERYDDQDVTVPEVAWMNDQGTSEVPPRPFMTVDFMDFVNSEFKKDSKELFKSLLLRKNVPYLKEIQKIADKYTKELQDIIFDYPGSNSQWWAEVKGFNDPLYHTGTMVNAVSNRIKRKRSK